VSVPFAVSDIIERVRTRADLPAFNANTNVTDAMVLSMVQESARDLSALLNDLEWYFVTTQDLATTAGVPYVSLPANCATVIDVTWLRDSVRYTKLRSADIEAMPSQPTMVWANTIPAFRLAGNLIELFPTPDAVYSLRVRYSTGAFIASAADTLFGQAGWDTWIIYNVCCIIRQREDRDYSAFAQERDKKLAEVMATARRERGVVKRPRQTRLPRQMPWPTGKPWWVT
jgi:hypothetical protein